MNKTLGSVLALAASIALAADPVFAVPARPVATVPIDAPPITLTLLAADGSDVTETWLPEVTVSPAGVVTGVPVTIRVAGATGLVGFVLGPGTTAYRGSCTNFGPATDVAPDFDLSPNGALTPRDCGGTAVVVVTDGPNTHTFVLPADNNGNGIPDSFEARFGGFLDPAADLDGDGLANIDEYRGFIVSRKQVRGDPTKKDLFAHLVNVQAANSLTLPMGNSLIGKPANDQRLVHPIDGTTLDLFVRNLTTVNVHLIGFPRDATGKLVFDGLNRNTDEMIDRLVKYSIVSTRETWVYTADSGALVTVNAINRTATPALDRVINANRILPTTPVQKAVRCIESLDVSRTSPIGSASHGTPNQLDECVIYTQRIVNYINTAAPTTENRIHYATHDGKTWQPYTNTFTVAGQPPLTITRNFIISKVMQWVFAHEGFGHDGNLTLTATGVGFHDPIATGGMLDERISIITSGTPAGLKFKIPSLYLPGHLSGFQVTTTPLD
jgi:hypothetical protein